MVTKARAIPEGYTTITPSLVVKGAAKAIDFYREAFGAEERSRMSGPDGTVMHAELQIGNALLMLADEGYGCRAVQTFGGSPVNFYVYVENVDKAFQKAVAAGAKQTMALEEMFWGDRVGQIEDPFGYRWMVATHTRDLSPKEMEEGQRAWSKKMESSGKSCG
jgi:PhnB protein